jgi:hypothetical protein
VANAGADISFDSRRQLVQAIAQLPFLKQCTMKIYNDLLIFDNISKVVFQSLEYVCLCISSLDQLVHLCRHAPNLKRLVIDAVIQEPLTIDDCSSLANLTHLSIRTNSSMEEFERLLIQARSLISLSLVCSNFECRDGNRWQQLLSKIHLSKFHLLFFADPSAAMVSLIDPFREKLWLEHGWYIRYEQNKINGYINLYTIPYPALSFLPELSNTGTFATTTTVDTIEIFKPVRELVYLGCETEVTNNSHYFFPHIETLVLETDALPPTKILSFEHITELRLHTPLTRQMLSEVSMPALTRLVLKVLPETWTIPSRNGRIQYLKLRTTTPLTDEQVESMCNSASFAINCKHISLPIRSKQNIGLLLNQLTYLESIDFIFLGTISVANSAITEDLIRKETCLRNFLLTVDVENQRMVLWIGKSNYTI